MKRRSNPADRGRATRLLHRCVVEGCQLVDRRETPMHAARTGSKRTTVPIRVGPRQLPAGATDGPHEPRMRIAHGIRVERRKALRGPFVVRRARHHGHESGILTTRPWLGDQPPVLGSLSWKAAKKRRGKFEVAAKRASRKPNAIAPRHLRRAAPARPAE